MEEKKIVAFGDAYNGEQNLLCPNCNEDYIHQIKTEIFERGEDWKDGLHISIESYDNIIDLNKQGLAIVETSLKNNPSPRRQGLRIYFLCELCGEISKLNIYQHKGVTLVEWNK